MKRILVTTMIALLFNIGTALATPLDDGLAAYNRGDYLSAVKICRPLAAKGDPIAQYILGWLYREGQGVPQDYAEAIKWYRLAAAQGLADAQNNLALRYANGQAAPQEYSKALKT